MLSFAALQCCLRVKPSRLMRCAVAGTSTTACRARNDKQVGTVRNGQRLCTARVATVIRTLAEKFLADTMFTQNIHVGLVD
jgi:hypothetical protein